MVRRQARGLRRMESILDAAEDVIADVGYAQATTNAIAAQAGMSPGSLYQFFRNKEEILEALFARYVRQLRDLWDTRLTAPDFVRLPLPKLIDQAIDTLVAFKSARPAFWTLFHGSAVPDRLAAVAAELHEEITGRLEGVFASRAPELDAERRTLLATMAVAMVRAAMPMVLTAKSDNGSDVLDELKRMLVAYLAPAVGMAAVPEISGS